MNQEQHPSLTGIPVFFRPEMVADAASRVSPSAAKPAQAVADWIAHDLPVDVRDFDPVDEATLALAHDPQFVRGVLAGTLDNGFGNRLPQVAASLPFTSGAMLAAAREALANGQAACAPVSGFHHAGRAFAHGFCTFNGLLVAALALRAEGRVQRVAILDLDHHFGDGSHDIVRGLGLHWVTLTGTGPHPPRASQAQAYLRRLPTIVSALADHDLLLYQAGADAHVDDPLGGWMSSEQLARRDQIVFEVAATVGLPVAWNLAGGYQRDAAGGIEPVLALHRQTLRACADVHVHGRIGIA